MKRPAEDAIWFDFAALCEGPRAVADYIEIGRTRSTVLVSGVPQFGPLAEDAARRFIELVDEFYDRRVKLLLSAAAPSSSWPTARACARSSRAPNRLIEMGSEAYPGAGTSGLRAPAGRRSAFAARPST